MDDITINNIMRVTFESLHKHCFGMVNVHVDYTSLDSKKFVYLLGYYPAIYNYFSELYTFMINQVRVHIELSDKFLTGKCRDKRDLLEQILRDVKFQYESLSRKVTLLTPNIGRGDDSL